VFGLDALSSAAYGPEAALTILIPLGLAGVACTVPLSLTIIVLLSIVYFSYRQTITAYPTGGSRPDLWAARGEIPGADPARLRCVPVPDLLYSESALPV
jgi:hypothetical protein